MSRAIQRHNSIHAGVQLEPSASPLTGSGTAYQPKNNSLDHKHENATVTPAPTQSARSQSQQEVLHGSLKQLIIYFVIHRGNRSEIGKSGGQNPGKELTETKLDRNQGGLLEWRLGRPVGKRQVMGSQSKKAGK